MVDLEAIRFLQGYVAHWRYKRGCWIACPSCHRLWKETDIVRHAKECNPSSVLVYCCRICNEFTDDRIRMFGMRFPFTWKTFSKRSDFLEHFLQISEWAEEDFKILFRVSNKMIKLTPDTSMGAILQFVTSDWPRCKVEVDQEVAGLTICPFCLRGLSGRRDESLNHLKNCAIQLRLGSIVQGQIECDLRQIEHNFRRHCMVDHHAHFLNPLRAYVLRCCSSQRVKMYERLFTNVFRAAFDLEVLQKHCVDPPYDSCAYCLCFRSLLVSKMLARGIIEKKLLFPCTNIFSGCGASFPNVNLLIRHIVYARTHGLKSTPWMEGEKSRERQADKLLIYVTLMKHALRMGSTHTGKNCHICDVLTANLQSKCVLCPTSVNGMGIIAHFWITHRHHRAWRGPITYEEQQILENPIPWTSQSKKDSISTCIKRQGLCTNVSPPKEPNPSLLLGGPPLTRHPILEQRLMATLAYLHHGECCAECRTCDLLKRLIGAQSPQRCALCPVVWHTPAECVEHLRQHSKCTTEILLLLRQYHEHCLAEHDGKYPNLASVHLPPCSYCRVFSRGRLQHILAFALRFGPSDTPQFTCFIDRCDKVFATSPAFFRHLVAAHRPAYSTFLRSNLEVCDKLVIARSFVQHHRAAHPRSGELYDRKCTDCVYFAAFFPPVAPYARESECVACLERMLRTERIAYSSYRCAMERMFNISPMNHLLTTHGNWFQEERHEAEVIDGEELMTLLFEQPTLQKSEMCFYVV